MFFIAYTLLNIHCLFSCYFKYNFCTCSATTNLRNKKSFMRKQNSEYSSKAYREKINSLVHKLAT